ncbi:MAG TPA: hypothetical protein DIS94_10060 [Bacteroidetes bacterium]|nr:hypothetical protein [Bacteroidota bacterium]
MLFTFDNYDFYFDLGDYELRRYKNKLKVSKTTFDVDNFTSVSFECFSIQYLISGFNLANDKKKANAFLNVKIYFPELNYSNLIEIDSLVENNIFNTNIRIKDFTNNYSIHKFSYNKTEDQFSIAEKENVYLLKSYATTWDGTHKLIIVHDGSIAIIDFKIKSRTRFDFPLFKESIEYWINKHIYIGIVPYVRANSIKVIVPLSDLKYGD